MRGFESAIQSTMTMQSPSSLERMYRSHHAERRNEGFVLLGEERGAFLKRAVGTGKRVLDIGCRDGALTKSFVEGNTVTGLDIDSEALARAHEQLGIETRSVDLNGPWGLEPRSFDAVVAAEVIEHLYHPAIVIEKVASVLAPSGIFAGSVPNAFSLKNRFRLFMKRKKGTPLEDPTHINHFTIAELRAILEHRFEKVEIVGFGRHRRLARWCPQTFAFGLLFYAERPKGS